MFYIGYILINYYVYYYYKQIQTTFFNMIGIQNGLPLSGWKLFHFGPSKNEIVSPSSESGNNLNNCRGTEGFGE